VGLHDGYDQAIVCQQSNLLAQCRGSRQQGRQDRQNLDVALQDLVDRLPEGGQFLDLGGVGPQAGLPIPAKGQPKRALAWMVISRWETSLSTWVEVKPASS
jgi:hypothetical protein